MDPETSHSTLSPKLILQQGHCYDIQCIIISNNGKLIASGSSDFTIKLWDFNKLNCISTFYGHKKPVSQIEFSPNNEFILSRDLDSQLKLWSLETYSCEYAFTVYEKISSMIIFSNQKECALACEDGRIMIWDLMKQQCITTTNYQFKILCFQVFACETKILAGGSFSQIYIFNINSDDSIKIDSGHKNGISHLSISPNENRFISGGIDTKIKIWDFENRKCLFTIDERLGKIQSLLISPDGNQFAYCRGSERIQIRDLNTFKSIGVIKEEDDHINSIAYFPDGQFLISGSSKMNIKKWHLSDYGQYGSVSQKYHLGPIEQISFTLDCKNIVTGGKDGSIRIWDLQTGKLIKVIQNNSASIRKFVLTNDGSLIASIHKDNSILIQDLNSGDIYGYLEYIGYVSSIDFNPFYQQIIFGNIDGCLELYDYSQNLCQSTITAHSHCITQIKFHEYRKILITASDDLSIKVWSVEQNDNFIKLRWHINLHDTAPEQIIFSDCGQLLIIILKDHSHSIWDLQRFKKVSQRQNGKFNFIENIDNSVYYSYKKDYNNNLIIRVKKWQTLKAFQTYDLGEIHQKVQSVTCKNGIFVMNQEGKILIYKLNM